MLKAYAQALASAAAVPTIAGLAFGWARLLLIVPGYALCLAISALRIGALFQVNRDLLRAHGFIAIALAAPTWLVRDTPLFPWSLALALGASVF